MSQENGARLVLDSPTRITPSPQLFFCLLCGLLVMQVDQLGQLAGSIVINVAGSSLKTRCKLVVSSLGLSIRAWVLAMCELAPTSLALSPLGFR